MISDFEFVDGTYKVWILGGFVGFYWTLCVICYQVTGIGRALKLLFGRRPGS